MSTPNPSGFTRWPNQLFGNDLGPHEKLVFVALLAYRFQPGDEVSPSQRTIARMIGLSVPTVKRAVRNLVDAGWIESRQRGGAGAGRISNAYRLEPGLERLPGNGVTQIPSPEPNGVTQIPSQAARDHTDPVNGVREIPKEDVKTEESFSEEAKELCSQLADLAKRNNPDHRIDNKTAWLTDMQALLNEGHSPRRITEIINYAFKDQFWATRIPAPASLTKSWNTLTAQHPHHPTATEIVAAYEARQQAKEQQP